TEKSLKDVREDNEKKLNEIKTVVDEKLTKSLDERIAKSFVAISERLDAVNKGLGEMQVLSNGVTDLKNVLSNVKTRGVFGEVSLANILENILTSEQYFQQFQLKKNSQEKVDFAVILPGKSKKERVYLPIDAKFPLEDYQRIVASSQSGDIVALAAATKNLEKTIKIQAKSIKEKYILPPDTVDFAIMYLPIEGLYAEVVRNPGLIEELQNKYKVIPAGPTTVTALLSSLQIGFRTLAIQKSSREVFDLLGKFKADFNKFVDNIDKAQSQVQGAGKSLEQATKRTTIILKKLDKVEGIGILEDQNDEIAIEE
ncbi:MAG TPA: DNA recombination protein RmuC, partial [Clostridia bacterium]|nr:DNA recombination protein RmuC [Clostridia bacterium]